jgi:hypothetical protein
MSKFLILLLAVLFLTAAPSYADPADPQATNPISVRLSDGTAFILPGAPDTVAQASITNATTNVANTSTTITLAAASKHVIIKTDPAAAIIYVDLTNSTATTADFRIDPGGALIVELAAGITAFKYIGATATGTISVCAF